MADFFGELSKKISDAASDFGKKAEDTLEVQKVKSEIRTLNRANERDLIHIGKMFYDKFQKGEISELDCLGLCEAIVKREEEIKRQEEEIEKIKGVL